MFAALTAAARVLAIVGASDLAASLLASRSLFAVMVQAFIAEMGASRLLGIDWQGPPDAGRRRRLFLLAAVALLAGVLPSAIAMLLFHARVTRPLRCRCFWSGAWPPWRARFATSSFFVLSPCRFSGGGYPQRVLSRWW